MGIIYQLHLNPVTYKKQQCHADGPLCGFSTLFYFPIMYELYENNSDNLPTYLSFGPEIRVLGMINRLKPIVQTHCQIWFQDSYDPVIVPVQSYKVSRGNLLEGFGIPQFLLCLSIVRLNHFKNIMF